MMQIFKFFKYNDRGERWVACSLHWFSLNQIKEFIEKYEKNTDPEKLMICEYENTKLVAKCKATKILNLDLTNLPQSISLIDLNLNN